MRYLNSIFPILENSSNSEIEKFKEDLEFYTNSGIFADTIDFTYEKIAENKLHIAIGKASCYCYDDIDVTLQLSDGVDMETVTKQFYEDLKGLSDDSLKIIEEDVVDNEADYLDCLY